MLIQETTLPNGLTISLCKNKDNFVLDGSLFKAPKTYKNEKVAMRNLEKKISEWSMLSIVRQTPFIVES